MNKVAVDTDVVSFGFRNDDRFEFYREYMSGKQAYISFMTWAELLRGSLSANWGEKRRSQLLEFTKDNFVVIETNRLICRQWALLTDQAKRKGRVLNCADGWIAATSAAVQIPLLTHNHRDFAFLDGLVVISDS